MTRRCSHCSNNGHNSRTCSARGGGVRLFGVRLMEGVVAMKKSASMGCLPSSSASSISPSNSTYAPASPSRDARPHTAAAVASGYASDDPDRGSSSNCRGERKKGRPSHLLFQDDIGFGIPWTEEEHRMFLMGLQKLGRGDWRGIARNFVMSRTPTQVASHAQKFFIRQMTYATSIHHQVPAPDDQLLPQSVDGLGSEPAEPSRTKLAVESIDTAMVPTMYPTFVITPVSSWPWPPNLAASSSSIDGADAMAEPRKIARPTPIFPKEPPAHVDEVVSMSKLSIADGGRMETTDVSLELMASSNSPRQSAFHANTSIAVPDLNKNNKSPIHAI
uniref:MYB protein n=1 Tax=Zingiber officinale TaxID=94328 RepID=A0AA50CAF3_ZINOF|nr:MYB protein [Zingiber officinale]